MTATNTATFLTETQNFDQFINANFLQALQTPEQQIHSPIVQNKLPIWLMRQAGRYLPEYKATRKTAGSFMDLAKNANFATEVTLQPLERYDLDAAILFSDILTIPDAMGLGLEFVAGEGPVFHRPLTDEASIQALQPANMQDLQYVFNAVSSIKQALMVKDDCGTKQRVPLIGFSGSPWTLACYMLEGQGSHNDFIKAKTMLYKRPDLVKRILEINTQSVITYLSEQIKAGCNTVMLFDSWGGMLAYHDYLEFSLIYLKQIVEALRQMHPHIPVIVFSKGANGALLNIAQLPCQGIGLDWSISLGNARNLLNQHQHTQTLQGNLDPFILMGSPEVIYQKTQALLQDYQQAHASNRQHIMNLGHGICQYTPPEHVLSLIQAVRDFKTIF